MPSSRWCRTKLEHPGWLAAGAHCWQWCSRLAVGTHQWQGLSLAFVYNTCIHLASTSMVQPASQQQTSEEKGSRSFQQGLNSVPQPHSFGKGAWGMVQTQEKEAWAKTEFPTSRVSQMSEHKIVIKSTPKNKEAVQGQGALLMAALSSL